MASEFDDPDWDYLEEEAWNNFPPDPPVQWSEKRKGFTLYWTACECGGLLEDYVLGEIHVVLALDQRRELSLALVWRLGAEGKTEAFPHILGTDTTEDGVFTLPPPAIAKGESVAVAWEILQEKLRLLLNGKDLLRTCTESFRMVEPLIRMGDRISATPNVNAALEQLVNAKADEQWHLRTWGDTP